MNGATWKSLCVVPYFSLVPCSPERGVGFPPKNLAEQSSGRIPSWHRNNGNVDEALTTAIEAITSQDALGTRNDTANACKKIAS